MFAVSWAVVGEAGKIALSGSVHILHACEHIWDDEKALQKRLKHHTSTCNFLVGKTEPLIHVGARTAGLTCNVLYENSMFRRKRNAIFQVTMNRTTYLYIKLLFDMDAYALLFSLQRMQCSDGQTDSIACLLCILGTPVPYSWILLCNCHEKATEIMNMSHFISLLENPNFQFYNRKWHSFFLHNSYYISGRYFW